jgi:hypothetical protein
VRLDAEKAEREDPRDEAWAPGVEALLGEVAGSRVHGLAPEARWMGAECRSRGCTLTVDCPVEGEEICQQLASALVIVDGMVLRPRREPADHEGRFLMLVDIELPPGDADSLRSAMKREAEEHPEVIDRLAESIEMIRRDREATP